MLEAIPPASCWSASPDWSWGEVHGGAGVCLGANCLAFFAGLGALAPGSAAPAWPHAPGA